MGSYTPRHLKHQPNLGSKVGRRGLAVAAGAAMVVPTAAVMDSASAAPAVAPAAVHASAVQAVAPAVTFTTHVTVLHYGSRGSLVKIVQQRIGHLAVDGSFGPGTLAAVKRFQRSHHLGVDGYVGPQTWYALGGYPGGRHTAPTPPSRGGSGHSSSAAVNVAKRYIGTPYVYGGESPRGFDCSGFVQYVYRQIGHSLPRTASAQQRATYRVSSPRPGDLVFFGYPAYHVGIYVGGGKMISARKPGTVIGIGGMYGSHSFNRVR
ncbi:NlpC/P60 family protein [Leekyejoonella antrihumi]|uniref:Cell wall lytic activity n=1 Tax=Leekyejoonella antrihumi TaxID=1660198 RepID=A0A563E7X4_9MICO|nr:NlpC/P60 family protein [Leekyejoonella antrihumi]TWP38302.1 cell wall lytic activity [Leekyejoonella antrihumi]